MDLKESIKNTLTAFLTVEFEVDEDCVVHILLIEDEYSVVRAHYTNVNRSFEMDTKDYDEAYNVFWALCNGDEDPTKKVYWNKEGF